MTIKEFQEFIREKYYATDSKRGTSGTFMWFIEEVGELATALAGNDDLNKEEEFADVFAWLCTLANINDVDLNQAIEKYTVRGVEGFKSRPPGRGRAGGAPPPAGGTGARRQNPTRKVLPNREFPVQYTRHILAYFGYQPCQSRRISAVL